MVPISTSTNYTTADKSELFFSKTKPKQTITYYVCMLLQDWNKGNRQLQTRKRSKAESIIPSNFRWSKPTYSFFLQFY